MTKIVLPYLKTYRSAGKTYAYYRRGSFRVRLPAEIGTTEFLAQYQLAHAGAEAQATPARPERVAHLPGSMGALLASYKAGHEYRSLGLATRKSYDVALELIPADTLIFPAAKITRAFIIRQRDKVANTPAKANYFVAVLRLVLSWGLQRGWLAVNPAQKIPRLKTGSGYRAWTDEEIVAFSDPSAGHMALPVLLGLYTGQRLGDILRLPRSAYDGRTLTLTQNKTGAKIAVAVHPVLKKALDAAPKTATTLCTRQDGHSWKIDHFKHAFAAMRTKLGLAPDVHFHGLRHSAASRLAEAGASDAQIQSVTGHKTRAMVEHYTAGARQKTLAKSAIDLLPRARIKNKTV